MERFTKTNQNLHYFFRNRLSELYPIMNELHLDGILLLACN